MNINTKLHGLSYIPIRLVFLVAIAFLSGRSQAATLTLQDGVNGYTGGASTHIRSDNPTTNYNGYSVPAGSQLVLGDVSTGNIRGLYSFDLSSLPTNATINSVTVTLTIHASDGTSSGNTLQVDLLQLSRSFNESTATWNTYDGTNAWTTAGGDTGALLASTSATTKTAPAGTLLTFTSTALATSLQSAYDASSSFNFLAKLDAESLTRDIYFLGGDNDPTLAYRPLLTIDYTVVPEPGTVTMLIFGLVVSVTITKRNRFQKRSVTA